MSGACTRPLLVRPRKRRADTPGLAGRATITAMPALHPEAKKAYDAKGVEVVAALAPMPPRPQKDPIPPEKNDAPITRHIGEEQINMDSYREYRQDYTGLYTACYFYVEGHGLIGVSDQAHESVVQLAARISNDKSYRNRLSQKFVYDRIVDWLRLRVVTGNAPSLSEHVEAAAEKAIRTREIWVPFPVIQIPHPIQIGEVIFRRITKQMMDEYAVKTKAYDSAQNGAVFDHLRTRLQSATAACVTVTAEAAKAREIAAMQADAAISILRLACPIMFDVYEWAPIDPGELDSIGGVMFVEVSDSKIAGEHSALPPRMRSQWVFSKEDVQYNIRRIWGFGHNLLVIQRNEFQDLLLEALIHFSKSVLKPDTSERLMYVVTALEALFVREGEPIVQNLRERLAVLSGPALDDRLKAAETITRVYDLRSRFVHRAVAVSDMAILADFITHAWAAMFFVLNNYNKWATKAAFLEYIDSYKFRGPEFDTSGLPVIPAG